MADKKYLLSFLNSLNKETIKPIFLDVNSEAILFNNYFSMLGAFSNVIEVEAIDNDNKKHIFELHLLDCHKGIDFNDIKITDKYESIKEKAMRNNEFYASINVIFIFNYDIKEEKNYLSEKNYIIGIPYGKLKIYGLYLNNFNEKITNESNDIFKWLYLFKNNSKIKKLPRFFKETIFEEILEVLDLEKWNNDKTEEYNYVIKNIKERIKKTISYYNLDKKNLKEISVKLNYSTLEKDLKLIPNLNINPEDIVLSLSINKLTDLAFNLFRSWSKNAIEYYKDLIFSIKDERVLVKDVETHLRETMSNFFQSKYFYDKTYSSDYKIGYIKGFFLSSLNTYWFHEYIMKRGETYKSFCALKSIQIFFQIEKLKKTQINSIYENFLDYELNIKDLDSKIKFSDLSMDNEKDFKVTTKEEDGKVDAVINNLINDLILKITNEKTIYFFDEIGKDPKYSNDFENFIVATLALNS